MTNTWRRMLRRAAFEAVSWVSDLSGYHTAHVDVRQIEITCTQWPPKGATTNTIAAVKLDLLVLRTGSRPIPFTRMAHQTPVDQSWWPTVHLLPLWSVLAATATATTTRLLLLLLLLLLRPCLLFLRFSVMELSSCWLTQLFQTALFKHQLKTHF